jgi:hypothetical protein
MAAEFSDVDKSIVMAGGVTTANLPHSQGICDGVVKRGSGINRRIVSIEGHLLHSLEIFNFSVHLTCII